MRFKATKTNQTEIHLEDEERRSGSLFEKLQEVRHHHFGTIRPVSLLRSP